MTRITTLAVVAFAALGFYACENSENNATGLGRARLLSGGQSCEVPKSGSTVCNIVVTIVPYKYRATDKVAWPSWQSDTGNGNPTTKPDTITFSSAVGSVTVTALDPDFAGDSMLAYGATNNLLGSVAFDVDNTPTVFTTSTKSLVLSGIRKVVLKPASNDYIAYDNLRAGPSGSSCAIGRPTGTGGQGPYAGCGDTVHFSPYVIDTIFPVWQRDTGHGNPTSLPDTVKFSQAVSSVTVTALDPNVATDSMIAYDVNGNQIAAVAFDGTAGVFTTSTKTVSATGIRKVILKPKLNVDYIAYDNLSFTP